MRQLIQSLQDGSIVLTDIPCPQPNSKSLLIQTHQTLISAGTERMLLEFGRAGLLGKIKQQPDKVKQVVEKVKTDGLWVTLDAVKNKLDQPIPLGYCQVGHICALGNAIENFSIGDRVVSNGSHAEMVCVPHNLCAKIPDAVSDESAAFTVLASIGLQGLRLAKPEMGETFAVIGLGLIGLITVQLLRANGCRVIGIDFQPQRLALAQQFGAEIISLQTGEDPVTRAFALTQAVGVDGVLITAATKSNDPVQQAAKMSRKRGRIVLVGITGLELSRADFYAKELIFQVSCSYGPGRYDPNYEEKCQDYPIGYVRWTEQRNFEAVLQLMAAGQLNIAPLITHRFLFEEAACAYDVLEQDATALGILLDYPEATSPKTLQQHQLSISSSQVRLDAHCVVNFIGSGNYASRILMPAFARQNIRLQQVCSRQGLSAALMAKKFGFQVASTHAEEALTDPQANAVVIATRHHQHAEQTLSALRVGKHVFVEKPLVLTDAELAAVQAAWAALPVKPILMVGFNRRFAPQILQAKALLKDIVALKHIIITVNAGFIPVEHWTQDKKIGGGRLLGEACHFVDLLRDLAGVPIVASQIVSMHKQEDQITISLQFADGSVGVVHYLANGHKAFPKERLEIFTSGKIIAIDNFIKMRAYGFKKFSRMNLWRQDKGQNACVAAFVYGVEHGVLPISIEEIFEVHKVCLNLMNQLA